jgi:hypothetical protein
MELLKEVLDRWAPPKTPANPDRAPAGDNLGAPGLADRLREG